MCTRDDRTVEDCLEVLDAIAPLGLRHLGFKDIGVDRDTLAVLAGEIRDAGATSYMELVSGDREACLESASVARDIGVDCVLGGVDVDGILEALDGSGVAFFPFAGRPHGHPTRLGGSAEDVARDCRAHGERGCAGIDLLAFRAVDADPIALVRAARAGTDGRVIVAGSINSPARIAAIAAAGADAFTIGSAAFDGSFSPRKGALVSQLKDIVAACEAAPGCVGKPSPGDTSPRKPGQ